jgi:hypothetical protein
LKEISTGIKKSKKEKRTQPLLSMVATALTILPALIKGLYPHSFPNSLR